MAKAQLASYLEQLSGKSGTVFVSRGRTGLQVRKPPTYKKHLSPDQRLQAERMALASELWGSLSRAQADAWKAYANTLHKRDPISGQSYSPTAYNAFSALVMKQLQVDPGAEPNLVPPSQSFPGEQILVTTTAVPGGIRFAATGPNSEGVVTELLVQFIPNPRRTPTQVYKSVDFVPFIPGVMGAEVGLPPGEYACAYRFVRVSTGQMSLLEKTGIVEVVG